ncbi:MAG: PAS domain-containing sensor histidine kinase [Caulobacter sp. 12-67-6]|nr:MAG: PAS domain-containing sensor histidine kinase [Caulobacter sp. 12-67-6]
MESGSSLQGGQIRSYGAALIAFGVAVGLRWLLAPWLGDDGAYLLFTVPIIAAVLFGGVGASLVAAALGLIAGFVFSTRSGADGLASIEVLIFLLVATSLVLVGAQVRRLNPLSTAGGPTAAARSSLAHDLASELNLLIDGATEYAICMLDLEGRVLIWNPGGQRLLGWSESEIVGQDISVFYPQDARDAGKPQEDLNRTRAEGKVEQEAWLLRKDGSEFLAHISITALHDQSGALRGFGKVLRNVTDQRASERALDAGAEHLRSILSTVPDAMVVIDDRGKILSFSTAAERLFGFQEADVLGENVSCLMPSPDRERHDDYILRYLQTGERKVIGMGRVVVGMRKDGTTFPMELSVGEATGHGPRVFTGFVRDLTERQRTQARLEELQAELIHIARVSGMGTMASTLAHELNQPITAVANYVEAVRDLLANPDPDDLPMIREALGDAAGEAMRAGHIVRRLRDFVARGEVEKSVEDLPSVIHEAAALGLMGARDQGLEPVFDLDPVASPVLIDRVQIQQVVINLARNAVEAMQGMEEPRLWLAANDQGDGLVRVTVSDNGPGVAPSIAGQLFTAFISTKAEGMGLGLSICRTIIEANGGRIWHEPRSGGGSQFHFTLVKVEGESIHEQ